MERGTIIENILKFEKKYKVDSWTIDGIHVWPLIRLELFSALLREEKTYVQNKVSKLSKLSLLKDLIYVFRFFLRRYDKSKALFAGADSHRINYKASSFNRYFDPVIDYLENELKTDSYIVEYKSNTHGHLQYYKGKRVIKFYRILRFFKFLNLKYNFIKVRDISLLDYDLFLKEASEIGFNTENLKIKLISKKVITIILYSKLFSILIKKTKPDHIFTLCYYNVEMLGMNLAADKLNIPSIDIQHGTQGPLHIAYTKWLKIPDKGYELLPNIFWCWDEDSYNNISEWATQDNEHKPILGGNFWNDYIFNSKEGNSIIEKDIILFTLQPIDELIDEYIIETIKNTHTRYNWYLRLHPRQLSQKDILKGILERHGILNKVNIDEATTVPLPILLKNTYIHISKFSGSILEAAYFNVPSIIIDKLGAKSFDNLVMSGMAQVSIGKSSAELTRLILNFDFPSQVLAPKRVDSFRILTDYLDLKNAN